MGKFSELWEEIYEKENQLYELMSEYKGKSFFHNGRLGLILYINPPEDEARVTFEDGEAEWVNVDDIVFE